MEEKFKPSFPQATSPDSCSHRNLERELRSLKEKNNHLTRFCKRWIESDCISGPGVFNLGGLICKVNEIQCLFAPHNGPILSSGEHNESASTTVKLMSGVTLTINEPIGKVWEYYNSILQKYYDELTAPIKED